MKAKTLLSRIALTLALILALSALAACDLSDLFGNGSSEEEMDGNGSVKTYIYTDPLPSSPDEINEKAWKASSKIALAEGEAFEPGKQMVYLGKVENKGKLTMAYQLYFNIKGEVNEVADHLSLIYVVSDVNGDTIIEDSHSTLSDFLGTKNPFVTGYINPGEIYYVSIMFYMNESASNTFEACDIGAKVYLACMSQKIGGYEEDEFGDEYNSGYISGGINTSNIYETTTYNPDYTIPGNETESSETHFTDLYYGSYVSWTSTNHAPDSTSSTGFIIPESGYLSFLYDISSESGCDKFVVTVNGNEYVTFSGEQSGEYYYLYVYSGDRVVLSYTKDSSVDSGNDTVYVYDLTLGSGYHELESTETEEESSESAVETEITEIETVEFPNICDGYLEYYNIYNFYCAEETDYYGNSEYFYFFSDNHSDSSTSSFALRANATGRLSFECRVPSESGCDRLSVTVNGSIVYADGYGDYYFSGTYEWYGPYDVYVNYGDIIEFSYTKDGSVTYGEDRAYIRNISFFEGEVDTYEEEETYAPTEDSETVSIEYAGDIANLEECISWYGCEFNYMEETDVYGNVNKTYYSTNHDPHSVSAMEFNVLRDGLLYFDYRTSSEGGCDRLVISVNGGDFVEFSGMNDYYDVYCLPVNQYDVIRFRYTKDGSVDYGEDAAFIRNLTFVIPYEDEEGATNYDLEFIDVEYFSSYNYDSQGTHRVWYNTNLGVNNSTATVCFYAPADGYITFDYTISTESGCDIFYVLLNGTNIFYNSGNVADTDVTFEVSYGDYVQFVYSKDSSSNGGSADTVTITDILFHSYN